jgi:hypothetical protein
MTDAERPAPMAEQDDIDEQELKRRYYERLSDWSETGAVKINRDGKLLEPLAELQDSEATVSHRRANPRYRKQIP